MPRDPADISRAPEDIVGPQIEHPTGGDLGAEQIARARVLDALGAAGGPGGVEQEERVLRIDPLGIAGRRLVDDRIVPPDIAARGHRDGRAGTPQHEHGLDARAALGEGCVGSGLELDHLTATPAAVGGDHAARAGVLDPVFQRDRGETAEHHRVDRADARTGLHRDHRFGHQRQIDHHTVTAADAARLERIGEAADLGMKFAVAQATDVARLALEEDRSAMPMFREVHIEAVVRDVQRTIGEPAVIGRRRLIDRLGEQALPGDLRARELRPEPERIGCGAPVQLGEIFSLQGCGRGERGGRREEALLDQHRRDIGLGAAQGVARARDVARGQSHAGAPCRCMRRPSNIRIGVIG